MVNISLKNPYKPSLSGGSGGPHGQVFNRTNLTDYRYKYGDKVKNLARGLIGVVAGLVKTYDTEMYLVRYDELIEVDGVSMDTEMVSWLGLVLVNNAEHFIERI